MDEFEFSSLMIPVDNRSKGLLRFSIEPKIKLLELKIELHQLMIDLNDANLVHTIMKGIIERCDLNPLNNDSIFGSINSKIVGTHKYNYYQLENLSSQFKFIDMYNDLDEEVVVPKSIFGWNLRLFVRDIRRMQRFINSFLFNYPIILDTLRFVEYRMSGLTTAAKSESLFNEPIKPAAEIKNDSSDEQRSIIDEILEFLTISPQLLSYLVHLILNYYRFYNLSSLEKTEKKMIIKLNSIIPSQIIINRSYIYGLLKSIENVSLDTVNLHTKNLVKFIYNYSDKLGSIELSCCNFILFFLCVRHIFETHKNWIERNIDDFFTNPMAHIKILNKYVFKISGIPIEYEWMEKDELNSPAAEIKKLSEKYAYMKTMDQEKFAETIFEESGKKVKRTEDEINIGMKNILDIESLAKNADLNSEFIDRVDKTKLNMILSYQKNLETNKITTNAFDLFMKFIENPVILITEKEKVSVIPNNVINCFEKLKNLLNDSNFRKENINTQHYYKKLIEVLPEDFQFSNIMYIIYQIIVPYMNFFYDIKLFEDVFLTTFKIE